MRIIDYFSEDSVMFINSEDKHEVLSLMVAQAAKLGFIPNEEEFKNSIFERESIMSTDMGWQVAIPHAKLDDIPKFFVIPAILSKKSDWGAGNKQTVNLVFLIGGPAGSQTDYLKILSKVTLVVRNANRRKAILKAKTAQEVLAQFAGL